MKHCNSGTLILSDAICTKNVTITKVMSCGMSLDLKVGACHYYLLGLSKKFSWLPSCQKLKTMVILPLTAFYPWRVFCCQTFVSG